MERLLRSLARNIATPATVGRLGVDAEGAREALAKAGGAVGAATEFA